MDSNKHTIIDVEDIKYIWQIIVKNWYYFIIIPLLAFVVSYIYTYKQADIYGAKTQILLKSGDVYNYQEQLYKGLGYYASYENTANQIRILKSSDLIRKVLLKLNLNISYYIIGRVRTDEVYDYMPFMIEVNNVNSIYYEQEIKLNIIDENSFNLIYTYNDEEKSKVFKFDEPILEDQLYITVFNNSIDKQRAMTLSSVSFMFKIHSWENLTNQYSSELQIENIEWSAILSISINDQIQKRAIKFLDTLSSVYIEYSMRSQIEVNDRTLEYIDKQLEVVIEKLQGIENELEGYKMSKSILDLSREEKEYFDEYLKYESQKKMLNLQLTTIVSLENYITNSEDEKLLPPSLYILENDDYLKSSLNELYALQMARTGILFKETVSSLSINETDQKIASLRKNILTYLLNTKKAINDQTKAIEVHISEYESIIKKIPGTERQMLQIQRRLDVNEKMYMYLLEKRANTIIAKAGIVPETKVIEKARSIGVVAPNKKKIHITFISIGIIIAILITFVKTTFLYKIENAEELRKHTQLPIVGEIIKSNNTEKEYVLAAESPKSVITESFRVIRTNLAYFTTKSKSKIILITSNNPGEGKTFCSINLASIIAKAGKKVLLLESDLHRPKIGVGLNLKSNQGLSSLLIGKVEVRDVILKSSVDNLDVILSGPMPPNASELILSENYEQLLQEMKQLYDYIIIDSPPTGLITDAFVIMNYVDVTLFVIHAQYASKEHINIPNEIVQTHKISNFALIMNGSKLKKSRYYYKGYGYYGYGYGYSSRKQIEEA